MLRACLFSITYDLNGYLNFELYPGQDQFKMFDITRRSSMKNAFNGKVIINDQGASVAGNKVVIVANKQDAKTVEFMRYMVKTYALIAVSVQAGLFLAHPKKFFYKSDRPAVELWIKEQI